MTTSTAIDEQSPLAGDAWRDQLEATVRDHVRGFIEELVEACASARGTDLASA